MINSYSIILTLAGCNTETAKEIQFLRLKKYFVLGIL